MSAWNVLCSYSGVSGAEVKGSVIRIDEDQIRGHVEEVVRSSVEDTTKNVPRSSETVACTFTADVKRPMSDCSLAANDDNQVRGQ